MMRDDAFPNQDNPAPEKKSPPDWERIELDYRAGIKSLREIATEHGISEGAIRKRARRDGWERDLSAKIQARAEGLVRKEAVRSEVRTERTASERQIVEANAQGVADVLLSHRRDIQRTRTVVMAMMAELEASCGEEQAALLVQLGEMMRNPDQYGRDKLNDLYQAIVSLPGRAKTMKDLAASLATLVDKEREAFNIGAKTPNGEEPAGGARALTDAERAVRLSRLFASSPEVAAAMLKRVTGNG